MIFSDWRDAEAEEIGALYQWETRRWADALGWDLAGSWAIVASARRAGHVPGFIARAGDGHVAGWTFYILHEGILQLGTMVGERASVVRALLERAMQSNEARFARAFSCFLFPGSGSLPAALARQRFAIAQHPYMVMPLASEEPGATAPESAVAGGGESDHEQIAAEFCVRPLAEVDPADVVRLMARAYAGLPEARCFAPDLRLEQWARYVGQLLATPAIGRYMASASFAVERRCAKQLQGAIITTSLSNSTAHVAQIVVDPGCRRSGLARRLIAAACAESRRLGHSHMSLVVSGTNEPAKSLYTRLGFCPVTNFIYASRSALMRQPACTRLAV